MTEQLDKLYFKEVSQALGYLTAWAPNVRVSLGDIIDRNSLQRQGNVRDKGIAFTDRPASTRASFKYTSARGVSINTLIEDMVARELPREVQLVENDLTETLDALRNYKGTFEDDWAAFAEAEGAIDDPIKATRVELDAVNDPLGVNSVFA